MKCSAVSSAQGRLCLKSELDRSFGFRPLNKSPKEADNLFIKQVRVEDRIHIDQPSHLG